MFASAQSEGGPGERIPPPSTMATVAIVPHGLTALMIVARTDLLGSVPERLARSQAQALGLQVIKAPYPNESWIVSAVRLADRQDSGVDWL